MDQVQDRIQIDFRTIPKGPFKLLNRVQLPELRSGVQLDRQFRLRLFRLVRMFILHQFLKPRGIVHQHGDHFFPVEDVRDHARITDAAADKIPYQRCQLLSDFS